MQAYVSSVLNIDNTSAIEKQQVVSSRLVMTAFSSKLES
jgi:hypothetical protein